MGASAEVPVRRVRQAAGVLANRIAQAPQALLSVGQRRVGRGGKGRPLGLEQSLDPVTRGFSCCLCSIGH